VLVVVFEHGQAAVGLIVVVAFAAGALGHTDPQRIVVGQNHAAHRARRAVADEIGAETEAAVVLVAV